MKERPILFSAPMVRAMLSGTKTQTRRVVSKATMFGNKTQDTEGFRPTIIEASDAGNLKWQWANPKTWSFASWPHNLPYGQPGDRLWVRETWKTTLHAPGYENHNDPEDFQEGVATIAYQAGGDFKTVDDLDAKGDEEARRGTLSWKPSIHMPRWASRFTLEVTSVRVERLQDISEADAKSEGIEWAFGQWKNYTDPAVVCQKPVSSYRTLWESINGPGSWDANPWVWVVEFRRVTP